MLKHIVKSTNSMRLADDIRMQWHAADHAVGLPFSVELIEQLFIMSAQASADTLARPLLGCR